VPSWLPSPICLGSVSPSPEVARHKSPREPRTAQKSSTPAKETQRQSPFEPLDSSPRLPPSPTDQWLFPIVASFRAGERARARTGGRIRGEAIPSQRLSGVPQGRVELWRCETEVAGYCACSAGDSRRATTGERETEPKRIGSGACTIPMMASRAAPHFHTTRQPLDEKAAEGITCFSRRENKKCLPSPFRRYSEANTKGT